MDNFYWIDAFSEGPFSGNPAAVCLLDAPASEAWMQALAFEMGLSETAFVSPEDGAYRLRWFTPKAEVRLCGHATLASCAALLDSGRAENSQPIRFQTLSGELRAWRRNDNGLIELDFPQLQAEAAQAPEGMLKALGLNACEAVARAGEDWLLEAEDEDAVRALAPDFGALAGVQCRGVCVTARSEDPGADFVSRFFAPAVGVNEDPVTGSAHCYLGPWWAGILGSAELAGRQLSSRGGLIQVSLKNGRAFLAGQARIVLKGQIAKE
jgi:PhzF family phenazine biosynthesis protein